MSSGGAFAGSALILLVATAGAGTGVYLLDTTNDLEAALDAAIGDALRDLSVDWLEVQAASATPVEDRLDAANLTIRLSGLADEIDLSEVVVETSNGTIEGLEVEEAIRDRDGSLASEVLTGEDLARVEVPLSPGLEPGETRELLLHHPATAPLHIDLTAPGSFDGTVVELQRDVYW